MGRELSGDAESWEGLCLGRARWSEWTHSQSSRLNGSFQRRYYGNRFERLLCGGRTLGWESCFLVWSLGSREAAYHEVEMVCGGDELCSHEGLGTDSIADLPGDSQTLLINNKAWRRRCGKTGTALWRDYTGRPLSILHSS